MADLSVGAGRCYIRKRDFAVQTLPLYSPIRLPDTVSTCTQTDETWLPYYGITSPPPKRPPTLSHLAGVSNEQHNSTSTPANSRLGPPVVIGKGSDLSAKSALDLTEKDQANVLNIVLGKPKPTQTSAPPPKVHAVPELVTQSLWDIPHPNPICLPPRPVKGSWSGTPSWSSSSAISCQHYHLLHQQPPIHRPNLKIRPALLHPDQDGQSCAIIRDNKYGSIQWLCIPR